MGGDSEKTYRGTKGTRPYAGAAGFYAAYRPCVSAGFMALLAEARRRADAFGRANVRFVAASSDDLPASRSSLGAFRTVLMGQSFHWMTDRDRVLDDLAAMTDPGGSVAFVRPLRVAVPDALAQAQAHVDALLERVLADVPPGPHPRGRHDRFETILARSAFSRVETLELEYRVQVHPTIESLLGLAYSMSHVLTRLGDRRLAFEHAARADLAGCAALGPLWVTQRDEALIGQR